MLALGPIGFLAPWLLAALIALPVLWWLLRAMPPAARRLTFPGVRLLAGLDDPERMPERTPWWLLLLRMLALAAAIIGFAEPVLNPQVAPRGSGPLLVLLDGGWASGPGWQETLARVDGELEAAERAGRPVALHMLSEPAPAEALAFLEAKAARARLGGLTPQPWAADRAGFAEYLGRVTMPEFETLWFADGLGSDGDAAFLTALQDAGLVRMVPATSPPMALSAPEFVDGALQASVLRTDPGLRPSLGISAIGPDPRGVERVLGSARAEFSATEADAPVVFDLPVELRNRVGRIALDGIRSAGAVALTDDGLKRRKVGLIAGGQAREEQALIAPLHYLRQALIPATDLIEASLIDTLGAAPDVVILADVGTLAATERDFLVDWVEDGGLLVRFAGPRLARSGEGQLVEDPLLPVRLRAGGRNLGGAMSWGAPKHLRPFAEDGPFAGLIVPDDVTVKSQVMAQPDPNLPSRVLAALDDGTPLITGKSLGAGRVVLFHVTANADWSNLPLSGLFVQMLERLAISTRVARPAPEDLAGQVFVAQAVLNGFGEITTPELLAGVDGARLIAGPPARDMPPGIYASGETRIAVNLFRPGDVLTTPAPLPAGVIVEAVGLAREALLKPPLLLAALALLMLDILATLWIGGRLIGSRPRRAMVGMALAALLILPDPRGASAQTLSAEETRALQATSETVLAYVLTGDARLDEISAAGLSGLTMVLNMRTAIEPAAPVSVDLERDELAFYPFLYWPITPAQPLPSDAAYARLNDYLRHGGMILFDTRDADIARGPGAGTPNGQMLQRLAIRLDIPPLAPVPPDHVLSRTFYLLSDYPGRHANSDLWVEAAPNVEAVEGLPFRNLNDGVTPVVIGGNDWASAWAIDASGNPMFPVGRGVAGAEQRELAFRFGVNLIMYVMTGNYKSDQVHVPALLERLGQ